MAWIDSQRCAKLTRFGRNPRVILSGLCYSHALWLLPGKSPFKDAGPLLFRAVRCLPSHPARISRDENQPDVRKACSSPSCERHAKMRSRPHAGVLRQSRRPGVVFVKKLARQFEPRCVDEILQTLSFVAEPTAQRPLANSQEFADRVGRRVAAQQQLVKHDLHLLAKAQRAIRLCIADVRFGPASEILEGPLRGFTRGRGGSGPGVGLGEPNGCSGALTRI